MMIALPTVNNFIFLCIDAILSSQISPGAYLVQLGTDVKSKFPSTTIDSQNELETEPLPIKPDLYIANLEHTSLNKTIASFQEKTTFNPKAKFVFFARNISEDDVQNLAKIFISNVVFIDEVSGDISTYYPYKNKAIHDLNYEITTINNSTNLIENKEGNLTLFEDKIPASWNNSIVKFCYIYEPPYSMGTGEKNEGINFDIFNFIASFIQLEPYWVSLDIKADGNLTVYIMESVKNNEICDFITEVYQVEGFDYTHPHVFDEIPIFVPAPLQIPRWKYLFKSLTPEIWTFWFFTSITLSVFWLLVFVVLEKKWKPLDMLEIFWLNIELFIEQSHDVSKKYISLKFLFFSIAFQSFLINMIFKCNFNIVLSGVIFEKPIGSLQDVVDSNLIFGLYKLEEFDNILELIEYGKDRAKYEGCFDCFGRVAFDRDMALHNSIRFYKYQENKFLDADGSPLIIKLEPSFKKLGFCSVLPLGHPLTPVLDSYILKLHAYGFNDYFVKKYDHGVEKKLPFRLQLSKLTLWHILSPSAILIGGYILGLVVYLFEVRGGQKKNQQRLFLKRRNLPELDRTKC